MTSLETVRKIASMFGYESKWHDSRVHGRELFFVKDGMPPFTFNWKSLPVKIVYITFRRESRCSLDDFYRGGNV